MDRSSRTTHETQDVLAILLKQRDLYGRLGQVAQRQRSYITGGEAERLLDALSERQVLIDELQNVAERMRPYQQNWPAVRGAMGPEQGQQVDSLLTEVNARLAAILEADKKDVELLAARKNATVQEMQNVRVSQVAGAAYQAEGGSQSPQVSWMDE